MDKQKTVMWVFMISAIFNLIANFITHTLLGNDWSSFNNRYFGINYFLGFLFLFEKIINKINKQIK